MLEEASVNVGGSSEGAGRGATGVSVTDDLDDGRSVGLLIERVSTGVKVGTSGALVGEGNLGIDGGGGGFRGSEGSNGGSSGNEENADMISATDESTGSGCE